MITILDMILSLTPTNRSIIKHDNNCGCKKCDSFKMSPSHLYWRARRKKRYAPSSHFPCKPNHFKTQEQFLGPVLRQPIKQAQKNMLISTTARLNNIPGAITNSPIISFGQKQRQALLSYWKAKAMADPLMGAYYKNYADAIRKGKRPTWHQSEKDMQYLFGIHGIPGHATFLNGKRVGNILKNGKPIAPKGSSIPDINPSDAMIEVKNYLLKNKGKLIDKLKGQLQRRTLNSPTSLNGQPLTQKVILDMRGQKASKPQLIQLVKNVANQTGLPLQNVQAVTWEFETI